MFDQVQVRALAGPLKDIEISPEATPALSWLCACGPCPIGRLNCHPSLRPWALWSWFSSRISLHFSPVIFPSILTSLPVPASEKYPLSLMLPTPCITVGMVTGFLQTWRLAFRPKSSILVASDQIILFLMVLGSLGNFWQTPRRLSCAIGFIWPLYHKGLIGGVLQRWLSFLKALPYSNYK